VARYIGPACRLCRRVGEKLFLKGERCYTPKCAVDRRRTPPGDKSFRRRRVSDHGVQLREKQKSRYTYGIMESQLRKYVRQAFGQSMSTGQYFMQQLETRLDNVVYRLGFGDSRRQARQIVLHGHIEVDGKKTNIPSYNVREGNVIAWRESHKGSEYAKAMSEDLPKRPVPEWLNLDVPSLKADVVRMPDETELDTTIDTRLIVEFYSR